MNSPKDNAKKTVALDIRGLSPNFKSHFGRGTGRYIYEISSRLKNFKHQNLNFKEISEKDLKPSKIQDKILNLSPLGKVTLECQIFFPRNIKKINSDLIHFFFHGDAPAYPLTKQITSILDVIPLKFPELYSSGFGGLGFKLARYLENKAAISSTGIIAISEATKKDVIDIFGIKEDRIFVTPLGVDPRFFILPEDKDSKENIRTKAREKLSFAKDQQILFYLGGIDPRKNVSFLIKILEELKKNSDFKESKLVIAGNYENDKHFPSLKNEINKSIYSKDILLPGFLSEEKLKDYFLAVDCFVFPSLYEGFGLPVIEAMAAGLPVFAGQNSSIPELMKSLDKKSGGWMLEDNNIGAWVEKIKEILTEFDKNSEFKYRAQANCIENAGQFTWDKTVNLTVSAYDYFLNK